MGFEGVYSKGFLPAMIPPTYSVATIALSLWFLLLSLGLLFGRGWVCKLLSRQCGGTGATTQFIGFKQEGKDDCATNISDKILPSCTSY
jgi:hypothetical protein